MSATFERADPPWRWRQLRTSRTVNVEPYRKNAAELRLALPIGPTLITRLSAATLRDVVHVKSNWTNVQGGRGKHASVGIACGLMDPPLATTRKNRLR